MQDQRICYDAQVDRLQGLLRDIAVAFEARDFPTLMQLGNRLATDSVIAGALRTAKKDAARAA